MDFSSYEDHVASLAFYPFAGEGTLQSTVYPVLGTAGEAGEVAEKIADLLEADVERVEDFGLRLELLHELGDVLWYITRVAAEVGTSLREVSEASLPPSSSSITILTLRLVAATSRVAERFKKAMRDDDRGEESVFKAPLTEERLEALREDLARAYGALSALATALLSSPEEVASLNMEKLSKRRLANTLQGEGDHR